MRLLLDNNLSPRLVELLTAAGWDVEHVRTLVRRIVGRRVDALAALSVANLPEVQEDLHLGSVVVIDDDSVRIRRLPIG